MFPLCDQPEGPVRGVRVLRKQSGRGRPSEIQAPVYGFYGGNDARIGASLPATTEGMKAASKVFEPVTYEGAGHGFMRSGAQDPNGSEADKKAREAAWVRLKSLAGTGK